MRESVRDREKQRVRGKEIHKNVKERKRARD